MVPLSFLTHMLAGLVAKLGLDQLTKLGYMPQATYIKAALKALEEDDLDEAVRNYNLSIKRWRPTQRTEVAAEIIAAAVDIRITKLQNRIAELDAVVNPRVFSRQFWLNFLPRNRELRERCREEQQGCIEAITVLRGIKERLGAASQPYCPSGLPTR